MSVYDVHQTLHQELVIRFYFNGFYLVLLSLRTGKLTFQQDTISDKIGYQSQQLIYNKRFRQIGIRSFVQPPDSIRVFYFRSQQYNRNMIGVAVSFQFLHQCKAIHFGHHDIGHYYIGLLFQCSLQTLHTVFTGYHPVCSAQFRLQKLTHFFIIIHYQHFIMRLAPARLGLFHIFRQFVRRYLQRHMAPDGRLYHLVFFQMAVSQRNTDDETTSFTILAVESYNCAMMQVDQQTAEVQSYSKT